MKVSVMSLFFYLLFAPSLILAADGEKYDFSTISYGDNNKFMLIKYDRHTGESWAFAKDGFDKIPEAGDVEDSLYRIEMIAIFDEYLAVRIDKNTGRMWSITKGKWVEKK